MPKWRSARLRRLYGKPTDPIENSDEAAGSPEPAGQPRSASETAPPPPPKRVRREKTRPESEYELIHHMPVTQTPPDYSLLVNPLSEKQAGVVAYAVHASRNNWLSGSMFETFWTRKPRGKKTADNQPNLRDKMTKLHECAVTLGPHTFPVKLFTVKDDGVHVDEEQDRIVEEKLAAAERERRAKEEAKRPKQESTDSKDIKQELNGDNPTSVAPTESSEPRGGQPHDREDHQENAQENVAQENVRQENVPQENVPLENVTQEKANNDPENVVSCPESKSPSNPDKTSHDEQKDSNGVNEQSSLHVTPQSQDPSVESSAGPVPQPAGETGTLSEAAESETNIKPEAETAGTPKSDIGEDKQARIEPSDGSPVKPKARRRGRPRNTDSRKASEPSGNEPEPSDRNRSFEMEKQNLEAEKRRVEELEKKLKGSSSESSSNAPAESGNSAESTGDNLSQPPPPGSSPAAPPRQLGESPMPNPSVPPPPSLAAPPKAVPNELVVSKLQQMAARDPTLGELMRVVASQTASHEDIAKFQEIINRVKASIFTPPPPPPRAKAKPKPKTVAPQFSRMQPTYQTRANSKAIMLAIEFDENPAERHLLPKRSILEYIPAQGQLLWSFLHVYTEDEGKQAKGEQKQRKIYTPVTATFHGIPFKVAQTLERCVRKPEVVAYYMKETMATAERAEPWNLWYRIEKNDEVLLESIKKTQAPTMAPPPPPRKPMKPRKAKPSAYGQNAPLYPHRRRPGEPLVQSYPMIIGRRGQPMVQAPSYYQHIQRKPRGAMANRAAMLAPEAGSARPVAGFTTAGMPIWPGAPSGPIPQGMVPTVVPQGMSGGIAPAPLNLPDPTNFQLPAGGEMPPLPRSMQAASNVEAESSQQAASVESKMEVDT